MKKYFSAIFVISYLLFFCHVVLAQSQSTTNISLKYLDSEPKFKVQKTYSNFTESEIDSLKREILKKHLENGYLEFSIDSSSKVKEFTQLYLHLGKEYKLNGVELSPDEFKHLSKNYLFSKTLTSNFIESNDSIVLSKIHNRGYPFAQLEKSYEFRNNLATLNYVVKRNKKILFDSIKTSPANIISYNYLSKKTGIEAGKPYNASNIINIKRKINQSLLFTLDSAYVQLINSKSQVTLKLKKRSQNSFNGLVGIQSGSDNKTEITGDISISLANSFKKGERINLKWRKPGNNSQQLETDLVIPYFFKTPVGISFNGNFDKQDSTFTNTTLKFGLLIQSGNFGELSVNTKWINSAVNSNSTGNFNSTEGVLYGLGYKYSFFDNPFLPKKGVGISAKAFIGNNSIITPDEPDSKTLFAEGMINLEFALPLPVGIFYLKNSTAIIMNDSLKQNNLYRIGGVNSIRGFNERSIYSKAYNYSNIEYRVLINSESFLYLLFDTGYFKEINTNDYTGVFRHALGVGISIKTVAGNLSISYAVGKIGKEAFRVNQGKIHIGYINRF